MKNKKLIIIGGVILGIAALLLLLTATGVLKLSFSVTKIADNSNPSPAPSTATSNSNKEKEAEKPLSRLSSQPIEFSTYGKDTFSISFPVGWNKASQPGADLAIGSLVPEKVPGGKDFTPNIVVASGLNSEVGVTSFDDFEIVWKDVIRKFFPQVEFLNEYKTTVNGLKVWVQERLIPRDENLIVRQLQYVFYVNDKYSMFVTVSAPSDNWDKYKSVVKASMESIKTQASMPDEP